MNQKAKGEILLHCLGIQDGMTDPARLEPLSVADWDEIMETAARHGVIPLLCQRLTALNSGVPASVLHELRVDYLHSSWKNMRRYHKLTKILTVLRSRGIPVIVLKGSALAELVYESIALRPMNDIDLLIRSEDVWQVDEVLSPEYENVTRLLSKRHARWVKHLIYRDKNTCIEVHLKIPELPELDPWANATTTAAASTNTLVLGTEDFLLHLCLHLDQHLHGGESRLIWWCDIVRFLKRYAEDIDWDYVIQIARKYQAEGAIHRVLRMINEGLNRHIPSNILNRLKDDGIAISMSDVLDFKQLPNPEPEPLLPVISKMPQIRAKIYHIFRLAFPRREYLLRRYSVTRSRFVYLYYFRSLAGVAAKTLRIFYQLPAYIKNRLKRSKCAAQREQQLKKSHI